MHFSNTPTPQSTRVMAQAFMQMKSVQSLKSVSSVNHKFGGARQAHKKFGYKCHLIKIKGVKSVLLQQSLVSIGLSRQRERRK